MSARRGARPNPADRRSAAPLAGPRLVHRGDARLLPRPRGGGRPNSAAACRGSSSPSSSASRDWARPRSCAPASSRGCGPRAIARCTCASTTRRSRRRRREQIKQAIFRATESMGTWTQAGVAVEGESLWEFLHHRDDILKDAAGRTVIPLLIFDQFEEIFTLAQADDAGRKRAAQFIEDLADLVENRPPKAVEARLETRRHGHRALRLRARRLPHPHRAARGLSRAPGEREGRDALDHAEPHAAGAHERPAGARGGDEARRQARLAGSRRVDRALHRRRLGTARTRKSSRRCCPSSAASSTTPASRRGAPRSPPTCSRARTTPSSPSSTSARWPTSRKPCAR